MTHNPYPPAIINGLVYHKPKDKPYAYGCNRGIIIDSSAAKADYEGIDLDPKGEINDSHSIAKLPDSAIKRLRVDYNGTKRGIKTARQLAVYCRDATPRKLIPCFEVKSSAKFLSEQWWKDYFLATVPKDSTPIIMSLPTGANNYGIRKLAAAHDVGLPTMLLWREDCRPYMKGWQNHVDLVKSRPGRGIYAVVP
jgi:hypothetical protein